MTQTQSKRTQNTPDLLTGFRSGKLIIGLGLTEIQVYCRKSPGHDHRGIAIGRPAASAQIKKGAKLSSGIAPGESYQPKGCCAKHFGAALNGKTAPKCFAQQPFVSYLAAPKLPLDLKQWLLFFVSDLRAVLGLLARVQSQFTIAFLLRPPKTKCGGNVARAREGAYKIRVILCSTCVLVYC